MPNSSLAAHFALSPSVSSLSSFVGTAGGWFESLVYSEIDTPDKRAAIVAQVMGLYDATASAIAKKRPLIAAAFAAARPSVQGLLTSELETLANSLAPQPPSGL